MKTKDDVVEIAKDGDIIVGDGNVRHRISSKFAGPLFLALLQEGGWEQVLVEERADMNGCRFWFECYAESAANKVPIYVLRDK